MRVGIIGGGFTGLTAAWQLTKEGHEVTVLEKDAFWGGLASAFEILPGVSVERFYHHLFTNDEDALSLCRELKIDSKLKILPGKTSHFYNGQIYPLDSALSVLKFSPLPLPERLRFGLVTLYLKFAKPSSFEGVTASTWLSKWYGKRAYQIVWEPLLKGKFAGYFDKVSMVWFWARVKKRTPRLIYPEGGFQMIIDALTTAITKNGGRLESCAQIQGIEPAPRGGWEVKFAQEGGQTKIINFDRLIVTTSTKTLSKIFPVLPAEYRSKLDSIKYINAQVLLLVLSKCLSVNYWMNIGDGSFPFLVVSEQSNLLGLDYYRGRSVVYLGNYLEDGNPQLSLNESELLDLYEPYLKKINSSFNKSWVEEAVKFVGPFAQPIVDLNYKDRIPSFAVPGFPGLYFATMAQVYPWDRGVNYAIKLAKDVVKAGFSGF